RDARELIVAVNAANSAAEQLAQVDRFFERLIAGGATRFFEDPSGVPCGPHRAPGHEDNNQTWRHAA
ncbi:MAG: hypothetical protein JSW68_12165, partial [Burkholderiales bacterium]